MSFSLRVLLFCLCFIFFFLGGGGVPGGASGFRLWGLRVSFVFLLGGGGGGGAYILDKLSHTHTPK